MENSVILMYKIEEGLKKEFLIKLREKFNKLNRVYYIQQIPRTRSIINKTILEVLKKNNIGVHDKKGWICITLKDGGIIYAIPHLECSSPILKLTIEY